MQTETHIIINPSSLNTARSSDVFGHKLNSRLLVQFAFSTNKGNTQKISRRKEEKQREEQQRQNGKTLLGVNTYWQLAQILRCNKSKITCLVKRLNVAA